MLIYATSTLLIPDVTQSQLVATFTYLHSTPSPSPFKTYPKFNFVNYFGEYKLPSQLTMEINIVNH